MSGLPDIIDALACCRCSVGPLVVAGDVLRCESCGTTYAVLGGIPCLVPDPVAFQLGWYARLVAYGAMIEASVRGLASRRNIAALPPRTHDRLLRVSGALQAQRKVVEALMAPVVTRAGQLSQPGLPARSGPEAGLSLLHHYENVFRDWAWGEAEGHTLRALVQRMAPRRQIDRLAVYGAGAGRLALDLHQHLAPGATFAIDLNPLPLTIAAQLTAGHDIELPEFPVAPLRDDQVVVLQRLHADRPRPGLTFMFADALAPPFAPGSLDVVVTPWFIDVVGVDLSVTAAAINRVLRRGGVWLNVGPLLFKGEIAQQYPIEEVLDLVAASGFQISERGSDEVPYFRSPHSGSSRAETLFWYAATKTADAAFKTPPRLQPPWVADGRAAVPLMPELTELKQSSEFTAAVLSMIDGQTSIDEMAARVAPAWNSAPAAAADHLRAFFGSFFGDPGTR